MQTFLTAARKAREAIFWPTPVVAEGTFDSSEFSKQDVLITAESGIPKCRKWWLLGRSFFWVGHSLFLMYCKTYYFVEHLPMGVRNCQTTDRSADMNAVLNNKGDYTVSKQQTQASTIIKYWFLPWPETEILPLCNFANQNATCHFRVIVRVPVSWRASPAFVCLHVHRHHVTMWTTSFFLERIIFFTTLLGRWREGGKVSRTFVMNFFSSFLFLFSCLCH